MKGNESNHVALQSKATDEEKSLMKTDALQSKVADEEKSLLQTNGTVDVEKEPLECLPSLQQQQSEGGAHAWLVVAACTLGQFLTASFTGTGIFYMAFLDAFERSSSETALAGSLLFGFSFGAGPLGSILCNLVGHRAACMLGSAMACTGFIISSFSPNLYVLYFSYGILIGTGNACIVVSSAVVPGFYFEKKRKPVMGIVIAGCGLGGLVFPLMMQYLIEAFTWRGAMLILGGVSLQGCVAGVLMRPKERRKILVNSEEEPVITKKETCRQKLDKQQCDFSLFKDWRFIVFVLVNLIRGVHSMLIFTTLPDKVFLKGLTTFQGAYLLVFAGVSSTVGRVLIGIASHFIRLNTTLLFGIMCTSQAVAILPLAFDILDFGVLGVLSTFYGGTYGMALTLVPVVTFELFGLQGATTAYGYFILGEGIGGFIGTPLAGAIYDVTNSYSIPYFVASGLALLGGILTFVIYLTRKKSQQHLVVGLEVD